MDLLILHYSICELFKLKNKKKKNMKTLTKQSQRYFLFFYVIILLKLVKSPSPDNEISYNSAINTSFLPNEFPEYISYINLLSDSG